MVGMLRPLVARDGRSLGELPARPLNRLGLVWAVVLDNMGPRQLEQAHGMRHGTARRILAEALWRYAEISGIWRGRRWEEGETGDDR